MVFLPSLLWPHKDGSESAMVPENTNQAKPDERSTTLKIANISGGKWESENNGCVMWFED